MRIRVRSIPTDSDLMRTALSQERGDKEAAARRVARVKELERRYAPLVAGLGELNRRTFNNIRIERAEQ